MIREAGVADMEAVRDVVLAAYQRYVAVIGTAPGPMLDDYAQRIAAKQVWVAEHDGSIAGILVLVDGPDCFLLDNIAVRPDRQGLGLGRDLLDFAEVQAMGHGWDKITLYTNALMTDNVAIYAARGYIETARRNEKGFNRIYMVKPLILTS